MRKSVNNQTGERNAKRLRIHSMIEKMCSPVVGSEQGGVRPVLVVQNDTGNKYSPTVIAAAVTSKINKARLPTHIELPSAFGLAKDSVILLEQIRTIDKKRLLSRIGELPPATMRRVNRAILISLGFEEGKI